RIMSLCTPISTSFPYTTLFRSVIEEAAGCSIPELFARGGEMLFRSCERQALIQFIDSAEGVIALGGGTLQQQSVIDKLKASGLLVFVEASLSIILPRIMRCDNRPLLMDDTGVMKKKAVLQEELHTLYQQRMPMYRQSHRTFKVSANHPVKKPTTQLLKNIQSYVP